MTAARFYVEAARDVGAIQTVIGHAFRVVETYFARARRRAMAKRLIRRGTSASKPDPFVRSLVIVRERVSSFDECPFNMPAIRELRQLDFDPAVTIIVGENGSGKSTLIEAIAVAAGFNPEGGSRNFNFATRSSESSLVDAVRLVRGVRGPRTTAGGPYTSARTANRSWHWPSTASSQMALPGATIYTLTPAGPCKTAFDEVRHVQLTRDFLARPDAYLRHLTPEHTDA